jgi:hypothetical protein
MPVAEVQHHGASEPPSYAAGLREALTLIKGDTGLSSDHAVCDRLGIPLEALRLAIRTDGAVFPVTYAGWLLNLVPDQSDRARIAEQMDLARAIRRGAMRKHAYRTESIRTILCAEPRSNGGWYLVSTESRAAFAEPLYGLLADHTVGIVPLRWTNIPSLVCALVEEYRSVAGERAACRRAAMLYRAMRGVPTAGAEEELHRLTLIYVLGDLLRQLRQNALLQLLIDDCEDVGKEARCAEVGILARRIERELQSSMLSKGRAAGAREAARDALAGFDAIHASAMIGTEFPRLYETWGSTYFSFAQHGLSHARSTDEIEMLFERHDGVVDRISETTRTSPLLLTHPWHDGNPVTVYHGDILAQKYLRIGKIDRSERFEASDRTISIIERVLAENPDFRYGESVYAFLNMNYCEALLLRFNGTRDLAPPHPYMERRTLALATFGRLGLTGMKSQMRKLELAAGYVSGL